MALNTKIRGAQIADAFAGNGLAKDGSDNLELDLNSLASETVQVSDDSIVFIDASDSKEKKESIRDFANALAGNGLDANVGSISVKVDDATVEIDGSNYLIVKDGGIAEVKLDINNSPTTGYFMKWNGTKMEWADVDVTAVVEGDLKKEDESANTNGSATVFTLSNTPVANSIQVFLNGLLQQEGSGKDYTVSGTSITFTTAPASDDILLIHYVATA